MKLNWGIIKKIWYVLVSIVPLIDGSPSLLGAAMNFSGWFILIESISWVVRKFKKKK